MRRVIVPALLAIALVASSSVTASAGLFDKLCGNSCDSCCDIEPTCGCEAPCAAPTCGFESVDSCCDSGCSRPKFGLLKKLFSKHHSNHCDSGCEIIEPACGCEAPACGGCAVEPACGCEVVDACCDSGYSRPKFGLLKKLFSKHRNNGCDSGCEIIEPACGGCAAEPTCGCEAIGPSCGCGA